MRFVKVILPLPPREVHSHNKGHWRTKDKHIAKMRMDSHLMIKSAKIDRGGLPWIQAAIRYHFFFGCNRARDTINYLQACKAYQDGIVDGGLITNDSWQHLKVLAPRVDIDREDPRVEITVFRRGK